MIHRDQVYLCHWLGLKELAAIEPKPGVPPSAGYLAELVTKLTATPPKMILRNAYNDPEGGRVALGARACAGGAAALFRWRNA